MPIRRVTFLGADGKPVVPAPSRPTPLEREVHGARSPSEPLEFEESRAPAPAQASVHHTILPAPVGAAQELSSLRRSNVLRDPPIRQRRASRRRTARAARTARTSRTARIGRASRSPARSRSVPGSRTTRTRRPVRRTPRSASVRTRTRTKTRTSRR